MDLHRTSLERDTYIMSLPKPADHVVLHFAAPNDPHGNPRRVYVVINTTGAFPRHVATFDEGYAGLDALAPLWGHTYNTKGRSEWGARVCHPRLTCTFSDYRSYVRLGETIREEERARLADRAGEHTRA